MKKFFYKILSIILGFIAFSLLLITLICTWLIITSNNPITLAQGLVIIALFLIFLIAPCCLLTFFSVKLWKKSNTGTINVTNSINSNSSYETAIQQKNRSTEETANSEIIANSAQSDNNDIENINKERQQQSNILYAELLEKISSFNSNERNPEEADKTPLTSLEKSFLVYMNNLNIVNPNIAQYWSYEYGINYKKCIEKFLCSGYLRVSTHTEALHSLTVTELKTILKENGLKQSGKKDDLLNRIQEVLTEDDIKKYVSDNNLVFILTDKGIAATAGVLPSVTKDLDFENKCLSLIDKRHFFEAYDAVRQRELSKRFQRGINVDYNQPLELYKEKIYTKLYSSSANPKIVNTVIFCNMIGVNFNKAKLLLNRLNLDEYLVEFKKLNSILHSYFDIEQYKQSNCNEYEILVADDACPKCQKMKNKVFKLKNAKIGVTMPPFCDNCRCTTVPYFDDGF